MGNEAFPCDASVYSPFLVLGVFVSGSLTAFCGVVRIYFCSLIGNDIFPSGCMVY